MVDPQRLWRAPQRAVRRTVDNEQPRRDLVDGHSPSLRPASTPRCAIPYRTDSDSRRPRSHAPGAALSGRGWDRELGRYRTFGFGRRVARPRCAVTGATMTRFPSSTDALSVRSFSTFVASTACCGLGVDHVELVTAASALEHGRSRRGSLVSVSGRRQRVEQCLRGGGVGPFTVVGSSHRSPM
jgi:hypothetical protein